MARRDRTLLLCFRNDMLGDWGSGQIVNESVCTLSHSRNAKPWSSKNSRMRAEFHPMTAFHHGDQDAEAVITKHSALGDLIDVRVLGDCDGEAAEAVDVEHDVDVGTAIADVRDAVVTDGSACAQFLKDGNFAVAGGDAENGLDLAVFSA